MACQLCVGTTRAGQQLVIGTTIVNGQPCGPASGGQKWQAQIDCDASIPQDDFLQDVASNELWIGEQFVGWLDGSPGQPSGLPSAAKVFRGHCAANCPTTPKMWSR